MLNEIIDTKKTKKNDVLSTAKKVLLMGGVFMLSLSTFQLQVFAMTSNVRAVASKVVMPQTCEDNDDGYCCNPDDPTEDYCCDRPDPNYDWKNPMNQQYAEQGCRERDIGRPGLDRDTRESAPPPSSSPPRTGGGRGT